VKEVIAYLLPNQELAQNSNKEPMYIDATIGGGGHIQAVLENINPKDLTLLGSTSVKGYQMKAMESDYLVKNPDITLEFAGKYRAKGTKDIDTNAPKIQTERELFKIAEEAAEAASFVSEGRKVDYTGKGEFISNKQVAFQVHSPQVQEPKEFPAEGWGADITAEAKSIKIDLGMGKPQRTSTPGPELGRSLAELSLPQVMETGSKIGVSPSRRTKVYESTAAEIELLKFKQLESGKISKSEFLETQATIRDIYSQASKGGLLGKPTASEPMPSASFKSTSSSIIFAGAGFNPSAVAQVPSSMASPSVSFGTLSIISPSSSSSKSSLSS
jgi:hypothetical protein